MGIAGGLLSACFKNFAVSLMENSFFESLIDNSSFEAQ